MALIKCPECGKIVIYKGRYCEECYTNFDNMNITDSDFITPIYENKFTYLSNESYCAEIVMYTERDGFMISYSPNIKDGYCRPIRKNGKIITVNGDVTDQYEMGEWYLNSIAKMDVYKGTIPYGNYFDVFCETETIASLDVWFTQKGDMYMYNPEVKSQSDLYPIKKGKYVREDDIIRYQMTTLKDGKTSKGCAIVINGRYCPMAYISEDRLEQYRSQYNKPISVDNPVVAPAEITEKEFFENYPCLICNARQIWQNREWKYYAHGEISVYAKCKLCDHVAQEIEKPYILKRIAYNGSAPIQGYRAPAGSVRYLDNPCPHCNAYQVRYAKWKDKRVSVSFWGMLSPKIGTRYKCDNCNKMWE